MTDYKKQAREIVQNAIKDHDDDGGYAYCGVNEILETAIAQALEAAAKPKMITTAEMIELAHKCKLSMPPEADIGALYVAGATHIANLNLMRALDEVFPDREQAKIKACDEGVNAGFLACYDWLKETLTARLK